MNLKKINVGGMITVKKHNLRKRNKDLKKRTNKNVHIVRRFMHKQVSLTDILKLVMQITTLFHAIIVANNSLGN